MRVCVDAQIVGEVVSAWTGIPIGKMLKDEMHRAHAQSTWAAASSARITRWA
jgi:ATP-dependent Clp protease ATP-binding subunit ClpA